MAGGVRDGGEAYDVIERRVGPGRPGQYVAAPRVEDDNRRLAPDNGWLSMGSYSEADHEHDADRYIRFFISLSAAVLSPDQSAETIAHILKELR